MRKLILSMQMTVDGFIAGPNGEMDWIISSKDEWKEMFKDLASVDTMLLGAGMYPGYAEYWRSVLSKPSSDKDEKKFAGIADQTPHVVFSKTLNETGWKNTRIARDVEKDVVNLKAQKGGDMICWGGAALANTLIGLGLIDEYRITLNPTLLGSGLRLFSNPGERQKLALKDCKEMGTGVVLLRYSSTQRAGR